MPLILTNDDGVDAPGIYALRQALGNNGLIIAPMDHLSGCSHQLTGRRPIRVERRDRHTYALDGTPADCARLGLHHRDKILHPDDRDGTSEDMTWVISGINAGANLGVDTYSSGTVAAVREAAFYRVPGIAISQYIRRCRPIDWEAVVPLAAKVLDTVMSQPIEPGMFWNINLPHPESYEPEPEILFCSLCTQPMPMDYVLEKEGFRYAGVFGDRLRDSNADVDVCLSGRVAVTAMRLWSDDRPSPSPPAH
jgi:5'-nucleotidase